MIIVLAVVLVLMIVGWLVDMLLYKPLEQTVEEEEDIKETKQKKDKGNRRKKLNTLPSMMT